jgi:hypothetical protein
MCKIFFPTHHHVYDFFCHSLCHFFPIAYTI